MMLVILFWPKVQDPNSQLVGKTTMTGFSIIIKKSPMLDKNQISVCIIEFQGEFIGNTKKRITAVHEALNTSATEMNASH